MKIVKNLTSAVFGTAVTTFGIFSFTLPGQAITISTSTGQVGNVNVATGEFTPFISGGPAFTDIAVDDDGQLFGNTFGQLYNISQSPGSSTLIGNLNLNNANALAFDNNGVLYATGGNAFYSVDISTGAATLISNISNFISAGDIVFNPATNQFLATSTTPNNSNLFSIALNGTATQIGSIGFNGVFGLGFDSGILYGYTNIGQQLVINTTTGTGIFDRNVTGFSGQIFGAASSLEEATAPPKPVTSVPEPTTFGGLIMLGFMGLWMKVKKLKPLQSA